MHQVKIEKFIAKDPQSVYQSLKEGKLFMNCSADSNTIQIDFRVGGKYRLNFKNHKVSNWGEFLEIVPDRKIVFSWCQTFGPDQRPDTKVTIELFPEAKGTRLTLLHTGFKDQSTCDNHYQGWNGGINDLATEMENGSVRLLRKYETSVEDLYAKVQSAGIFGLLHVIEPGRKLSAPENVTFTFEARDGGTSALQIIQENLLTDEAIKKGRQHWDTVTSKLSEIVG